MKRMLKGFTLVEIMIVVAIIAVLAAVAIPNFIKYRKTSQMNACISNLKQIATAVEQVRMNGKTVSWTEIVGADKYIKVTPACPSGGSYGLPTEETANPTCVSHANDSGYNHKLPTGV